MCYNASIKLRGMVKIRSKRIALFDSTKSILIFLVVLGHLLIYSHIKLESHLAFAIYTFHMPAFAFISGILTKDVFKSARNALPRLLAPYLVMTVLITFTYAGHDLGPVPQLTATNLISSLLLPGFSMWYLLALMAWRVALPAVGRMHYSFCAAILLGLAVGCYTPVGNPLCLSRIITMFPFFLLGNLIGFDRIIKQVRRFSPLAWLGVLFGTCLAAIILAHYAGMPIDWLFWRDSYHALGVGNAQGIMQRLLVYALSFLGVFSLLGAAPTRSWFLTVIGKNSLAVYLYHAFIFRPLLAKLLLPLYHGGVLNSVTYLLACLLVAALICLVLGIEPIARVLMAPFNYLSKLLFRQEDKPQISGRL
jgi:fucose 4-O-acetylase-like acetyltransferase